MSIDRITRVNELLHREIGASLYHVLDPDEIDLSAVTVTHVITSKDLRTAKVLVSILQHHKDRAGMMKLIRAHRKEIQEYVHKTVVLKYTPRLTIELDTSLERGDRVLSLLSEMAIPDETPDETGTEMAIHDEDPDETRPEDEE
jgi:ribosome-binding factor A